MEKSVNKPKKIVNIFYFIHIRVYVVASGSHRNVINLNGIDDIQTVTKNITTIVLTWGKYTLWKYQVTGGINNSKKEFLENGYSKKKKGKQTNPT